MTQEILALFTPESGLRLNNLFQRGDWTWQANVHDAADNAYAFGFGATAESALIAALSSAGFNVLDE